MSSLVTPSRVVHLGTPRKLLSGCALRAWYHCVTLRAQSGLIGWTLQTRRCTPRVLRTQLRGEVTDIIISFDGLKHRQRKLQ